MAEPSRSRDPSSSGRSGDSADQRGQQQRPQGDPTTEALKQALSNLEAAKQRLSSLSDLGGHRDKATTAIESAISETKEALAAADGANRSKRDKSRNRPEGRGPENKLSHRGRPSAPSRHCPGGCDAVQKHRAFVGDHVDSATSPRWYFTDWDGVVENTYWAKHSRRTRASRAIESCPSGCIPAERSENPAIGDGPAHACLKSECMGYSPRYSERHHGEANPDFTQFRVGGRASRFGSSRRRTCP